MEGVGDGTLEEVGSVYDAGFLEGEEGDGGGGWEGVQAASSLEPRSFRYINQLVQAITTPI